MFYFLTLDTSNNINKDAAQLTFTCNLYHFIVYYI